jgi:hypothetical protein
MAVTISLLFMIADYLLQHAEPSDGCGQHAPPFSSGLLLGVQHAEAVSFFGVQQEDCAPGAPETLLFASDGMFSVFMMFVFVILKDARLEN